MAIPSAEQSPPQPPPAAAPDETPPAKRGHHAHRVLVGTLMAIAFVTGLVAVFAVWANRQALNANNWTNTSGKLIEDPKIQAAVGAYLVDQLFRAVNVADELQGLLPSQISGLAGPAAAGLRQVADEVAPQLLAQPRIQAAWRAANRVAIQELLRILNGGSKTVSTANGNVTLDLNTIVTQLAAGLGVQTQLAAVQSKLQGSSGAQVRATAQQKLGITLPASTGQLVVLRSNQLKTAQDIASAIKGLAVWLTVLTLALFVAAVWLAEGWRRLALRRVGWYFIALGLLLVLARRIAGNAIVDGLVASDSVRPAAHDAWNIGTSLLYDIAVALVVYGIVLVAAAWLAGDTRAAVAVRRALAPDLRERPARVYGAVGGVFLLLLLWGPTPAFRQVTTIIGFIVLIALGVHALRRQTAVEFPDAQVGDATHRLRAWVDARRHHDHAALGHGARQPAADATGRFARDDNSQLAQLERAASLHDRGVLTDAEFAAQKSAIMNGS